MAKKGHDLNRTYLVRKAESLPVTRIIRGPERAAFELAGRRVAPGSHELLDLPSFRHYTHETLNIPIHVFHGRRDGPRLLVCAAVHGDELCGTEVIRRLAKKASIKKLRGTLVLAPVVNIQGFMTHSRYLPDRRDLNRSFPGYAKGSQAGRLAHLFLNEVVSKCTHGIDLHTGAIHRYNLPQIRAEIDHPEIRWLASAFDVPVIINATLREGSLREAAAELGIPVLTYEGGEALRFDEISIKAAVRGCMNVMRALSMLPYEGNPRTAIGATIAQRAQWVRAPEGGILKAAAKIGQRVKRGSTLGYVVDPFSSREVRMESPSEGIIIGISRLPTCNEGDGLYHIATFERSKEVASYIEQFGEDFDETME